MTVRGTIRNRKGWIIGIAGLLAAVRMMPSSVKERVKEQLRGGPAGRGKRKGKGRGRGHGRVRNARIAYFGWSFAEGTSQEDIFIADPRNGDITRITDDRAATDFISDRNPRWSPDRRRLAIYRASDTLPDATLYLLNAETGATVASLVPGVWPEWYDPDTLLFLRTTWVEDPVTEEGRGWADVFAVDVNTLQVTQISDLETAGGMVQDMSWDPVGGLAVTMEMQGSTSAISPYRIMTAPASRISTALSGGAMVTMADLTSAIMHATSPDWSPDGHRLAHVYFTQVPSPDPGGTGTMLAADVAVKDLTRGTTVVITSDGPSGTPYGENHGGHSPVFSPDGKRIAFTRGDEDNWSEIWLSSSTVSNPQQLTDENRTVFKGVLDW